MRQSSEATRRSVAEAAARLFDRHGYVGTSISAICREAQVTSGAVYFHFSGKDDLARYLVEEHFASWPAIIERVERTGLPALERVVTLSREVARAFRDDVVVRAGSRLWTERRDITAQMPRPFVGWIQTLEAMLSAGQADGSVDPGVDAGVAASALVCAFFGTHTVSDALDGRTLIEEHLHRMWLMFLPALRRDADPARVLADIPP
ncbi:MAG TPA: ScbR family autoregulator-binding transcription factor [Actinospica sp.]|jgi:AcrR family transcriptional regulator|nr:ScbR family autoregulator-binding transcription factor [Actinospica sp.]